MSAIGPISTVTPSVSQIFLTADVAMTTQGTAYDALSLTPGISGTYLLFGRVMITLAGAANVNVQLWDGSTTFDDGEQYQAGATQVQMTVFGTAVLTASSTVKLTCKAGAGSCTISKTGGAYGITNKATHLMAVRIA